MASTAATRFYRVYKEAGRPIPQLHHDDVIDYCVLEAIILKVRKEEEDAEKAMTKKQWKKDKESIARLRG